MTLKEFFRKARRGRKWEVTQFGDVRCANGHCPLAALTDEWDPSDAAHILGLRRSVARKIAHVADWRGDLHRPWLLKNLGIAP